MALTLRGTQVSLTRMTMPKLTWRRRRVARWGMAAWLAIASLAAGGRAAAQDLPARLADSTFWRMVTEMSEPGGYFRSDNLVSNETSFQYVIPELQRSTKPGGVYLGVAPEQNFTYLVALRPRIAFIVDIRRQNMLQLLFYKALFELSADRAEFVSRLFARARPAGLDTASSVDVLFQAYAGAAPDSAIYKRTLAAVKDHLVRHHGFALSPDDLRSIEYVYGAFFTAGPDLTYSFPNAGGMFGGRAFPSYAQLMTETDGTGARRSYLASETNYRLVKQMEADNLVIPLVGNFAGDKTLRGVGQYLRDRHATVTAFYTSNVEQYLFMQGDDWKKFYENVAALPTDESTTFIRSLSRGAGFRPGSPNSPSVQLLSMATELLKAYREGKLQSYDDVIQQSK